MTGITRTIEFTDITPDEMAKVFASWEAQGQAEFLNEVGNISRAWPGAGWCMQALYIAPLLDRDGQMVVEGLGNHYATISSWVPA